MNALKTKYRMADQSKNIEVGSKVNVTIMENGYAIDTILCNVTKVGKRISVEHWSFDRVKSFARKNVQLMVKKEN